MAFVRRFLYGLLDDSMMPMIKLMARGYRSRLEPYRAADGCDLSSLGQLGAPEDVQIDDMDPWRSFRVQAFTFTSPVDCMCLENRLVSGRLLWVDQNAPWVIIVPGYSTGAYPRYEYGVFQEIQARLILERGLNTALIDLPFHVRRTRNDRLSGEGFFSPDLAQTQGAFRQATADVIALTRWLTALSGQAVSLWGTSLGGCVAGLVATQVPELAAVALMEPLDNPGDPLAVVKGAAEIRSALAAQGISPTALPENLRVVAPSSYQPKVPLERLLFVTPLWDRVIPTRFQEAHWQSWGQPPRIQAYEGHVSLATNRNINTQVADFVTRWALSSVH
jgi:pimeloyl-ACP methyl ester carboxylesterase